MKKSIKGLNHKFFKNITLLNSLGICAACNSNNTVNKHNQDKVKGGSSKDDNEEDTEETNHAGEMRGGNVVELESKKNPDFEFINDSEQSIYGSEDSEDSIDDSSDEVISDSKYFLSKFNNACQRRVELLNDIGDYTSFLNEIHRFYTFLFNYLENLAVENYQTVVCLDSMKDILKEKLNFKFTRKENGIIDFTCGGVCLHNVNKDVDSFFKYLDLAKCLLDFTLYADKYKIDLSIYKREWDAYFCTKLNEFRDNLTKNCKSIKEYFVDKLFYFSWCEDKRILSGWKCDKYIDERSRNEDFEVEEFNIYIQNKINYIYFHLSFLFDFNSLGNFSNVLYNSQNFLDFDFTEKNGNIKHYQYSIEKAVEKFGLDELYYTNSENIEERNYIEEHISESFINYRNELLRDNFFVFKNRYFKFFYSFENYKFYLPKIAMVGLKNKPTVYLGARSIFFKNNDNDDTVEFKFSWYSCDDNRNFCYLEDFCERLRFIGDLRVNGFIDLEEVYSLEADPGNFSLKIGDFDLLDFEFKVDDFKTCSEDHSDSENEASSESILNSIEDINYNMVFVLDDLFHAFDIHWTVVNEDGRIKLSNPDGDVYYYLQFNTDTRKLEFAQ